MSMEVWVGRRRTAVARGLLPAFLVTCAGFSQAACSAKAPPRPSYATAYAPSVCEPSDGRPSVFTLDWRGDRRKFLKSVLVPHNDAVVVEYDCRTLRVLDNCRVGSKYAYTGTGITKEQVSFSDGEEMAFGMPLSGAQLAAQYGSGSVLWANTTTVGSLAVPKDTATMGDLFLTSAQSLDGCRGATHFVRRATLGAFDLRAIAKGGSSAGAHVDHLGGASSSASSQGSVVNWEGNLATCDQLGTLPTDTPIPGCDNGVQLELVPIQGPAVPDAIDVPACAPGKVMAGGKCITNRNQQPYLCHFGNMMECQNQCGLGDVKSCNTLGFMYETGFGVGTADITRAEPHYRAACDHGHQKGCTNLALVLLQNGTTLRSYPIQLLQTACAVGEARACTILSQQTEVADATDPKSAANWALSLVGARPPADRKTELLLRGCHAGDGKACDLLKARGIQP